MKECLNCGALMEESLLVCPTCKTRTAALETHDDALKASSFVFICPKHHKKYENFSSDEPVTNWRCSCGKGYSFIPYVGTAYPKPIIKKPIIVIKDSLSGNIVAELSENDEIEIGRSDFEYKSHHKMIGTLSHRLFSIYKEKTKNEYILKNLTNHSGIIVNRRLLPYNTEVTIKNGDRILINNFLYLTISEK